MALKALQKFVHFDLTGFLAEKRLLYVKAIPWTKERETIGSKVIVQIFEDHTNYDRSDITNFGEQLTVKMRNVSPDAFAQLKPLQTEVLVKDVEQATVYGEYRNQLSIIAAIAVKDK